MKICYKNKIKTFILVIEKNYQESINLEEILVNISMLQNHEHLFEDK